MGSLGLIILGEVENEESSNMVWVWVDSSSTIISTRMGSAQRLYPWVRLSDYMGDFGIDPPEDWVTVRLSSQLTLCADCEGCNCCYQNWTLQTCNGTK